MVLGTSELIPTSVGIGATVELGVVSADVAAGLNVLSAAGKHWAPNIFQNLVVVIEAGKGAGQAQRIISNSPDTLVIEGRWHEALDTSSCFRIVRAGDVARTPATVLEENIADNGVHASVAFDVSRFQEKTIYVYATAVAVPAPLNVWVELAHTNVATAYVVLGAAPLTLVVTGSLVIPWTTHSSFARVVAQCPGWVGGQWLCQVVFEGKG